MRRVLFLLFALVLCGAATAQIPALIPFNNGGSWGYVDTTFSIRITPQFQHALPFVQGKALVVQRDTLWQIDTAGNVVQYYNGTPGEIAFATIQVLHKGRKALIHADGRILLAPSYFDLLVIDNNTVAVVAADSTAGTLSFTGDTLETFRRIDMAQFDKLVAVDNQPECTFCRLGEFSGNRALTFGEKFFGFADSTGAVVIPFVFVHAEPFLFDLAFVTHNTATAADATKPKTGYVDRMGRFYYGD